MGKVSQRKNPAVFPGLGWYSHALPRNGSFGLTLQGQDKRSLQAFWEQNAEESFLSSPWNSRKEQCEEKSKIKIKTKDKSSLTLTSSEKILAIPKWIRLGMGNYIKNSPITVISYTALMLIIKYKVHNLLIIIDIFQ